MLHEALLPLGPAWIVRLVDGVRQAGRVRDHDVPVAQEELAYGRVQREAVNSVAAGVDEHASVICAERTCWAVDP